MSNTRIDFAIVGKPKCGTTALARFLEEHPDICISNPKEPNYFSTDLTEISDRHHGYKKYFPIRTPKDYSKCFSHCEPNQIKGEASPRYLSSEQSAYNIHKHNPAAKIIIMIRNPVDFMYSAHRQLVTSCIEDVESFEEALNLEEVRKKGKNIPKGARYPSHFIYTERAKYYKELKRYFDVFPREQILVLTNEEFKKDNQKHYTRTLEFLGANKSYQPNFKLVNSSKAPRFRTLNRLYNNPWIRRNLYRMIGPSLFEKLARLGRKIVLKDKKREPLSPELRRELEQKLMPDIKRMSQLLNRDLVHEWGIGE